MKIFHKLLCLILTVLTGIWFYAYKKTETEIAQLEKTHDLKVGNITYSGFPFAFICSTDHLTFSIPLSVPKEITDQFLIEQFQAPAEVCMKNSRFTQSLFSAHKFRFKVNAIEMNVGQDAGQALLSAKKLKGKIQKKHKSISADDIVLAPAQNDLFFAKLGHLQVKGNEYALNNLQFKINNPKTDLKIESSVKYGSIQRDPNFSFFNQFLNYSMKDFNVKINDMFQFKIAEISSFQGKEEGMLTFGNFLQGFTFNMTQPEPFDFAIDSLRTTCLFGSPFNNHFDLAQFLDASFKKIKNEARTQLASGNKTLPQIETYLQALEKAGTSLAVHLDVQKDETVAKVRIKSQVKKGFPEGKLTLNVDHASEFLNLLVEKNMLAPQMAQTAHLMLTNNSYTTKVKLKNKTLSLDGLPLKIFEDINWNEYEFLSEKVCQTFFKIPPKEYQALLAKNDTKLIEQAESLGD